MSNIILNVALGALVSLAFIVILVAALIRRPRREWQAAVHAQTKGLKVRDEALEGSYSGKTKKTSLDDMWILYSQPGSSYVAAPKIPDREQLRQAVAPATLQDYKAAESEWGVEGLEDDVQSMPDRPSFIEFGVDVVESGEPKVVASDSAPPPPPEVLERYEQTLKRQYKEYASGVLSEAQEEAEPAPPVQAITWDDIPLEDVPSVDVSLEDAPSVDSSLKDAPSVEVSVGDAPSAGIPLEDAPVMDAPMGDIPFEDGAAELADEGSGEPTESGASTVTWEDAYEEDLDGGEQFTEEFEEDAGAGLGEDLGAEPVGTWDDLLDEILNESEVGHAPADDFEAEDPQDGEDHQNVEDHRGAASSPAEQDVSPGDYKPQVEPPEEGIAAETEAPEEDD